MRTFLGFLVVVVAACAPRQVPAIDRTLFATPRRVAYALAWPSRPEVASGPEVRIGDQVGMSRVLERRFVRSSVLPAGTLAARTPSIGADGAALRDPTELLAAAFLERSRAAALAAGPAEACTPEGRCPRGTTTVKVGLARWRLRLTGSPVRYVLRHFEGELSLIDATGVLWRDRCTISGLTLPPEEELNTAADQLVMMDDGEAARRLQLLLDRAAIACGEAVFADLLTALGRGTDTGAGTP